MSIFNDSISIFKTRRLDVIYAPAHGFFYASWYLLRIRSEQLIIHPKRTRYGWQRAPYIWRRKGALRKARKNFPKNFQLRISHRQAAYRWHINSRPIH